MAARAQSSQSPHDVELTLATGDERGVYYRIGREIANQLSTRGISIRVITSGGSIDNLRLLASNKVQMCFAQADVLNDIARRASPVTLNIDDFCALVPLYTEPVHILVRRPVKVRRLSDMQGKRISVGPSGGGSERNALAILEAAGVMRDAVGLVRQDFGVTADAMNRRELDVAFVTVGCPSPFVETLMQTRCCSLFEPDRDSLDALMTAEPCFVLTRIPAGTYANQNETIDTLGVPAILLVRSDMDLTVAESLTSSISESLPNIVRGLGLKGVQPSLVRTSMARLKRLGVIVHPGAKEFYDKQASSWSERLTRCINFAGVPALLLVLIVWGYKHTFVLVRFYQRYPAARAVTLMLVVMFLGSAVMFYAEGHINDSYASYSKAFWSTLINWLNFGAKEPVSVIGRICSTTMTFVGMGGVAWLLGGIAAFLIEKRFKEVNMCKGMKQHFVVINWNAMGPQVLSKIRSMQQELDSQARLVLVSKPKIDVPGVVVLDVDPLSDDIIASTKLQFARSVIILSQAGTPPDVADAQNILIVLHLGKLLSGKPESLPHIIVELLDPGKARLLSAGVLSVEVVSSQSVATDLIVQVAGNPGLTQIYSDLLTNGDGSSEIYSIRLEEKWVGKTFGDLCAACARLRAGGADILPLAISRSGKVEVNPSAKTIAALELGDVLFAVCDDLGVLRSLNGSQSY